MLYTHLGKKLQLGLSAEKCTLCFQYWCLNEAQLDHAITSGSLIIRVQQSVFLGLEG